ncbi:unnamed protein product [Protopolystoma xenopodis]|uniref:Uncharacterized protein n=1 Tax=Protopolystoma xenopodis TaxID=117903 RepID=A0A448WDG0_9PLAT|nr:unnamed protein product [Protopolystoma xenopodis]
MATYERVGNGVAGSGTGPTILEEETWLYKPSKATGQALNGDTLTQWLRSVFESPSSSFSIYRKDLLLRLEAILLRQVTGVPLLAKLSGSVPSLACSDSAEASCQHLQHQNYHHQLLAQRTSPAGRSTSRHLSEVSNPLSSLHGPLLASSAFNGALLSRPLGGSYNGPCVMAGIGSLGGCTNTFNRPRRVHRPSLSQQQVLPSPLLPMQPNVGQSDFVISPLSTSNSRTSLNQLSNQLPSTGPSGMGREQTGSRHLVSSISNPGSCEELGRLSGQQAADVHSIARLQEENLKAHVAALVAARHGGSQASIISSNGGGAEGARSSSNPGSPYGSNQRLNSQPQPGYIIALTGPGSTGPTSVPGHTRQQSASPPPLPHAVWDSIAPSASAASSRTVPSEDMAGTTSGLPATQLLRNPPFCASLQSPQTSASSHSLASSSPTFNAYMNRRPVADGSVPPPTNRLSPGPLQPTPPLPPSYQVGQTASAQALLRCSIPAPKTGAVPSRRLAPCTQTGYERH